MLSKSIVPQVVQLTKTVQYAATYNAALITTVLSDLSIVMSQVVLALRNVCSIVQLQTVDITDTDRLSGQLCPTV